MLDQISLNSFVYSKIKDEVVFSVDEAIEKYRLYNYFPADMVDRINLKDRRPIRQTVVTLGNGMAFIVCEFGSIRNSSNEFMPIYHQKIGGLTFDAVRVKIDGKIKVIRVADLMLRAFKGAKHPRDIKFIEYMPGLPAIVDNLTYVEKKQPDPAITRSMTRFVFASQRELDGFLWTYNISTLAELSEALDIPASKIDLGESRVRQVEKMPSCAEYSLPFEVRDRKFRINRFGGVKIFKNNIWKDCTRTLVNDKIRIFFTSGGKLYSFSVANKMFEVFEGSNARIRVGHIDKNPYNLVMRNLWHKNCGRKPYFTGEE